MPFVSFSVDVLVRFVSVMYCVVQNKKMSRLIHIVVFIFILFFLFWDSDVSAVPLLTAARQ